MFAYIVEYDEELDEGKKILTFLNKLHRPHEINSIYSLRGNFKERTHEVLKYFDAETAIIQECELFVDGKFYAARRIEY